jgi:hypothetical protein
MQNFAQLSLTVHYLFNKKVIFVDDDDDLDYDAVWSCG